MLANESSPNPVQLTRFTFWWILRSSDGCSGAEEQISQSVFEVISQEDRVTFLVLVQQLEETRDTLSVEPLS